MLMEVLANGSAHVRPFARPPFHAWGGCPPKLFFITDCCLPWLSPYFRFRYQTKHKIAQVMVFTLIYHIIVEIASKYYIDFDNTDIKF